ncbi:MAG TPA: cobalamin-binding protein, partial [Candidatus Acidoferrales bacterium]|nr:cobalamin-binding protein [Candidatus Acidoferrales bacterium]
SATEILFGIGAGDDVVGVTHECDFPAAALELPRLTSSALPDASNSAEIDRHVRASLHSGSSLYHLDSELLERLAPDLIITQELCKVCAVSYEIVDRAAKRLTSDPRVVSLEPSSLDDVLANIEFVGELTGHVAGARALVEALSVRIEALRAAAPPHRPRTLVLEWTDPPMGAGHWTPGLVELAGGTPILSNPGANSQRLEWAAIAQADPDTVIVAPCGFDIPRANAAIEELAGTPEWTSLRAQRERRVHVVDGNAYVNRPGPRLVDTAEIFARLL